MSTRVLTYIISYFKTSQSPATARTWTYAREFHSLEEARHTAQTYLKTHPERKQIARIYECTKVLVETHDYIWQ